MTPVKKKTWTTTSVKRNSVECPEATLLPRIQPTSPCAVSETALTLLFQEERPLDMNNLVQMSGLVTRRH